MTRLVRDKLNDIVTRAFDRYGYFPIDDEKVKFFQICLNLVLSVCDLIDEKRIPNAKLVKNDIIKSLYTLGFNQSMIKSVLGYIFDEIKKELRIAGFRDNEIVRVFLVYKDLILESVSDYRSLFKVEIVEYLNSLEAYSPSKLITSSIGKSSPTARGGFPNSRLVKRFNAIFDKNVKQKSDNIVLAAFDINNIISDSNVKDYELPDDIELDLLTATFNGAGKKIYDDVVKLFNLATEFGGYQGSFSGSVEYQSLYYSYLYSMCYGKESQILGESFGNFEEIFRLRLDNNKEIPGLKFLEPLYRNKMGDGSNPLAVKYSEGLKDRYQGDSDFNELDYISLTLEVAYTRCLIVGDKIIKDGSVQMDILSKVFPPSSDFSKRSSGLTGGMYVLLSSHNTLSSVLGPNKISPVAVKDTFLKLKQSVDSLIDTFRTTGFKPGGYVPSLELNYHEPRKSIVEKKIKGLGFTESETQEIISATNFSELLERLAPITDSSDVISFFRAFDLTKLIYEFGGQSAIDQYIEFLYGKDSSQSLIRLLGYLDVNRTQRSIISENKYPKLIGYLVMLTYAVNPVNLQVFSEFLRRNGLNLLESVSLLIEQNSQSSILLKKENVSLLSGMLSQMVINDSSGYDLQKPIWNKLIEKSSGNVGKDVKGIYLNRDGITPTELYQLLNNPSAGSPLGEMLNGVRGGRLTSVLRYCNLFGLLYSLSDYRNSYQLINRKAEEFGRILDLVSSLDQLSQVLDLGILVLGDSPFKSVEFSDPIVQAQSRVFDAFVDIIEGKSGSTRSTAEPPGIGNSRIPNGVKIDNSLTPEESRVLLSTPGSVTVKDVYASEPGSYIRFSIKNQLSQGVIVNTENLVLTDTPDPEQQQISPPPEYNVHIRNNSILRLSNKFDPVNSCKKFGGVDCDSLGVGRCEGSGGYNKSNYPETGYGTESGRTGITIDRPLGESLAWVKDYKKITSDSPSYYYSVQGLTELSRTPVLKDNEMLCASIKDPFEYSSCISMLKCKRFVPPHQGKYYLPYCPRTLSGGRLAP